MAEIAEIINQQIEKCGKSRKTLLPILQGIVREKKYLEKCDMVQVAKALDISSAEVYGTASFYSFLDTTKRGKYVIRVCKSIIAEMKGKKHIIKTLEKMLHIKVGETTTDNKFTLLETNDIGWSDHEPSMLINGKPYTDLTPAKVREIIIEYSRK